jgi:hypothetical protein
MAAKKKLTKAIVANRSYGLYYGEVVSFDAKNGIAVVRNCRHVCRWFGMTGGITSLAAHGLRGPRAGESRVGAPAPGDSTLTGIVNVFPCSLVAAASIEAVVQL